MGQYLPAARIKEKFHSLHEKEISFHERTYSSSYSLSAVHFKVFCLVFGFHRSILLIHVRRKVHDEIIPNSAHTHPLHYRSEPSESDKRIRSFFRIKSLFF